MIVLRRKPSAPASLVGAPQNCVRPQLDRPETANLTQYFTINSLPHAPPSRGIAGPPEHMAGHSIYSIPIDVVPASFKSCYRQRSGAQPAVTMEHSLAGALPINTNDL
jgi:hypothetical protein